MNHRLTPVELKERLAVQPDLLLIDVRTPIEFDEVHIPGSRNIPLGRLSLTTLGGVEGRRIYLVCRSGRRSEIAAEKLANVGITATVRVSGGVDAWVASGFPVYRGSNGVISLERQVRLLAGVVLLAALGLGFGVHPGFLALVAAVGLEMIFAGITDLGGFGLFLANAPWNRR
jgi:rhodanese-related sulfurtransferase